LKLAGLKLYGEPGKDGMMPLLIPIHIIGDAHFSNLFNEKPKLMLFIAYRQFADRLTSTGGGIEIQFQQEAD
jgi:hypothetical protein